MQAKELPKLPYIQDIGSIRLVVRKCLVWVLMILTLTVSGPVSPALALDGMKIPERYHVSSKEREYTDSCAKAVQAHTSGKSLPLKFAEALNSNPSSALQIAQSLGKEKSIVQQLAATPSGSGLVAPGIRQAPPPPAMPKHVRKGPKKVTIFKPSMSISANASDSEISSARVFLEPLIPMPGSPVLGENQQLARILTAFKAQKTADDITILQNFLAFHPQSRWRPSLEANLAWNRFERGYLTDAHAYWQSAWEQSKSQKKEPEKAVGDEAISQLCLLEARLGQTAQLDKHIAEVNGRALLGSVEQKIKDATTGLWCMKNRPDLAFRCGPFAVNNLLSLSKGAKSPESIKILARAKSTTKGTNLAQLKDWADQVGLHYQMAKRSVGAPFIVPSVFHWKAGHFAAMVAQRKGRYQLKDPTFDINGNLWTTSKALEAEGDGYALVPSGPLPNGWKQISRQEAETVWGKGDASSRDGSMNPGTPKECISGHCCGGGMAQAFAYSMQAVPNIIDVPLGYNPPVGPAIGFSINYNYLEGNQPTTFTFTNLGFDWSLNWVSYLTLDASQNATVRVSGGGYEVYQYTLPDNVSNPYPANLVSQAVLAVTGDGVYQRRLSDGSIEVFNQPDGSGRIFMTQVIDPQGNSASITYDAHFRATTVTDAIGQASSISYVSNTFGNTGFYLVLGISDPFSRSCSFSYDSTDTYLTTSTDVVGLQSQYTSDAQSSFIDELTTPYGSTYFYEYNPANSGPNLGLGLQVKLPDGTQTVLENWINDTVQSYYWDREAMMSYPNDWSNQVHTHCKTTQWVLSTSSGADIEEPVPDFILPPLENQTNFLYQGATNDGAHWVFGSNPMNKPITVSRNITGGGTQTWNYQYNLFGHVTRAIDPIGRQFTFKFAANNIDLLEARQNQGTNNDLNGKWEYSNSQHVPNLNIDGSGQHTQYSYNTYGELQTLTDALSEIWTLSYNSDGYLTQIQGPLSGSADVTIISYDGYGRVYQVTDSEGYVLTYSYDNANRLTQVTYPDGTNELTVYNNLDAIFSTDRIGRTTQDTYDKMDQLAFEIDPLGRKSQFSWCACGSLSTLTDPNGNVTTWQHDLEGRAVKKIYQDNSNDQYSYDSVGRLSTRTDALSQVTTYGYTLDNTLSSITYTNTVNPTSTVNLTYDPNYPRISTVANGWGTYTYSYNPYITDPYSTATSGAGMVSSFTNNVIANSAITFSYDALGRTTNRSINGSANSVTWTFDAMSRITREMNALGTFNYSYLDDTPGSSKGTLRLASISYPNGQHTNLTWYGNQGDQRLQGISNQAPGGVPRSQFCYGYDSAGEIVKWGQQNAGMSPQIYSLGYDLASQLITAQTGAGGASPPYSNQYYYNYDAAANRTGVQTALSQTAQIGGTVTAGDTLTITVQDPILSGGTEAVSYVVQSGDTLSTIAANISAAITADANLQSLGVNAVSNGVIVSIKSVSANVTTYVQSTSGGATETITLGISRNTSQNATISGAITSADTLTMTVYDAALSGGHEAVSYSVLSTDTPTTIATALKTAINVDSNLSGIGVSATSSSATVHISSSSLNLTTYAQSTSSGATEAITLAMNMNGVQTALVGGSKTTSDVLNVTVYDAGLSGGSENVTYTVQASDTLSTITSGLATAINADSNLQAIGVTASSASTLLSLNSVSINNTAYVVGRSIGATETIVLGLNPNGVETAAVGGTKTTGDILTISVYDAGLSGGSKAETYTIQSTDTLASIASGMASVINGDSALTAIGVTATAVSTAVNIKSTSVNATTYTQSTSGGATETLTLGYSTGITQSAFNNLNELTSISGGGATRYQGTTNKAVKSVTINSTVPATLNTTQTFTANPVLSTGNNATTVKAVDGGNNSVTNTYQVTVSGGTSSSLTYDANGNMTSDGTNTYGWDAEDRLIKIIYPGSGNFTTLTYDALGANVSVVETASGVQTSTRQFIWTGGQRREVRDGSGNVISQTFALGEVLGGTKYFYGKDHLGSIREMSDNSGSLQTQYVFDPFGRTTRVKGGLSATLQFASYYAHAPSSLYLTATRAYNTRLGRFINRDPVSESGGTNLYGYSDNTPAAASDPSGLDALYETRWAGVLGFHEGLVAEIDTNHGPVYYSIDGIFSWPTFDRLDVHITQSTDFPRIMFLSFYPTIPFIQAPTPLTTDGAKVRQVVQTALTIRTNLRRRRLKYNALPDIFGWGATSNQVAGYLIKSAGLRPPWIPTPGFDRPLPDWVPTPLDILPTILTPNPPAPSPYVPHERHQDYHWPPPPPGTCA